MSNTREKLIELLKSGGVRDFPFNAALADHLIANGITIQKWIPVTERLPETTCLNLAMIGELPFLAYYDGKQWRSSGTLRVLRVEHWMPLPEPPKGE